MQIDKNLGMALNHKHKDSDLSSFATLDSRYVNVTGDSMTDLLSINVPTTTSKALVLKTTDDNTTNKLLQLNTSANVEMVSVDAVGQIVLTASGTTRTPLTIKAAASQSANIFSVTDSGGVNHFRVGSDGKTSLNVGGVLPIQAFPVQETALSVGRLTSNLTLSRGIWTAVEANNSSTIGRVDGLNAFAYKTGTANVNNMFAGIYEVRIQSTGASTVGYANAATFQVAIIGGSDTDITTAQGIYVRNYTVVNGATITDSAMIHIAPSVVANGGVITNNYGLQIGDQTAGSTLNYAIYTGLGDIRFGDDVLIASPNASALTIGAGTAGIDYQIKVDGETNDGTIDWMEDEDYFRINDDVLLPDNEALKLGTGVDASLYYDGTDMIINPKVVGTGVLKILGDISLIDEDIILGTTTGTKIGTSTTQKLGFFGVTPVVQQTELTDELTTITFTAPGTPDYTIQNLTAGGFGFVTADEGNTVLSVIANLQARVNELETKLVTLGLLADAD